MSERMSPNGMKYAGGVACVIGVLVMALLAGGISPLLVFFLVLMVVGMAVYGSYM